MQAIVANPVKFSRVCPARRRLGQAGKAPEDGPDPARSSVVMETFIIYQVSEWIS